MTTLGAILAGGKARRFGRDKALAEWRGRPLIDHVRAAIAPYVEAVVVVGRDLPDRPGPRLGPLGGLNAALAHALASGFDRVVCVPCDTPVIGTPLLEALAAAEGAAFVPQLPVIGVWPAALSPRLDAWLAQGGDRSVKHWAAAIGAVPLVVADGDVPTNVNTPDDLGELG